MPFEKEKADIRGMVVAGNYGWAILALMELTEGFELHCQDKVEVSVKNGRLRSAIQGIVAGREITRGDVMDAIEKCPGAIILLDFQGKQQAYRCGENDNHEGSHVSLGVGSIAGGESRRFTMSWD